MKLKSVKIIAASAFALMLADCAPASVEQTGLIPAPNECVESEGSLSLSKSFVIAYSSTELQPAAQYLSEWVNKGGVYSSECKEGTEGDVMLKLNGSTEAKGAYSLQINANGVEINGDSYAGVMNGVQTLRQLMPSDMMSSSLKIALPYVAINDAPRYEWRGIMLDVSRHFYTVEEVKEFLDLMALYKLNKFHWHLTDDQGWRIEIKKYPLLTEKGAWRKFNEHDRECMRRAKAEDNSTFEIPMEKCKIVEGDTLYGGYYTQEQIKDIVAYAAVRAIDVIPEIDMPGHFLAAAQNYDGVTCFKETGWGEVFSSPICPGKDSAMELCKNIYDEMIDLFPYKYVHIGGDEVEKINWRKCPDCQKRIKANNLKNEEELQAWFIHEMEKFINSKGKDMIGWDETIEGGLSNTETVMWWRSWAKTSPKDATSHGNNIVFTPNEPFYLDYSQDKFSVSKIYNYDPNLPELTDAERKLIKGVQGNIWCEWIPSRERMHFMAVPRMLAIAELGWSAPEKKNWEDFENRMVLNFKRLNAMNINYRIPDLTGFRSTNVFIGSDTVKVECIDPSAQIYYTTDGTIPTTSSTKYDKSLVVDKTTDFTFRAFKANGWAGDIYKCRFIASDYSAAVEAQCGNEGLTAAWYDYTGPNCAGITEAKFNGDYKVAGAMIPEGVKGNIGLVITGYINVPADGIYSFDLLSDDGSYLKIDNEMVVDNDGEHSPQELSGQKAMKAGLHPVEVRYFDHNGGQLRLKVYGPDGSELAPETIFKH